MRRRSFPGRPGIWRNRFVQIARELEPVASPPPGGFGLRPRVSIARSGPRAGFFVRQVTQG